MIGLDLHAIADMVSAADSPGAAWCAFRAALARNGFDRASLHLDLSRRAANPFAYDAEGRMFGVFWDADLHARLRGFAGDVRRTEDHALLHLRPTLMYLAMFHTPMFVDHLDVVRRPSETPFVPISTTMLEMGQYQALVLPLVGPASDRMSSLNLWGDDPSPDFARFARANMAALQAAGLCFTGLLALRWPPTRARKPMRPRPPPPGDPPVLSTRERQILTALAEGAQIDGVADALGITERTAREYVSRARMKLGARTRTEAVALALMMGAIDPRR